MSRKISNREQKQVVNTASSPSIDEQAARWAVDMAYGDMAPDVRAALSLWLEADPRHRGAYIRARAALHVMEEAVVEAPRRRETTAGHAAISPLANERTPDPAVAPVRPLWKSPMRWSRKAIVGGLALAASIAMVVALNAPLLTSLYQSQAVTDEQIVKLKDGSIVTLAKEAKIEVALRENVRSITVLHGEALFKVAKDKSRPFVVRSGDVFAQATGTAYSVKRIGAYGATVKVIEGSVLVWPRDARDQAVQLYAGDTVTLDLQPPQHASETSSVPISAPPPELAQISLDNVSVRSAVARFNRVNSTQIVIADPEIDDIRIVGLFEANDVEKFAEAVAALSGGSIERTGNKIVIKMK